MPSQESYQASVERLKTVLRRFQPGEPLYVERIAPRDQVFDDYQRIFCSEHIPKLTSDEFKSFLQGKNNRHWSGLHRGQSRVTSDMSALRRSLLILLDEKRSIRTRFPESLEMVPGLGKAIATAILTVAYPQNYGVWNAASEARLREFNLWPAFHKDDGIGDQYNQINALLKKLASDLRIDLWTLDCLWGYLKDEAK